MMSKRSDQPDAEVGGPQKVGRDAESPGQIPPQGWMQVAKRVFQQISEDRVLSEAAAVTFYVILSLFPALAALVSIYGLVADPTKIQQTMHGLAAFVPSGGMQIIGDQINALTAHPTNALGLSAIVALLSAIWSANAGVKGLFDALNVVYSEHESRKFVWRTAITLCFTVGGILFLLAVLGCVVALPIAFQVIGLNETVKGAIALLRWPVLLFLLAFLLAIVYRYGPSRLQPRWRWVSWGSGIAAVLWVLTSAAFSFYVSHFGTYNKTYGSLGAAIGFMTWIWLSTTVVLIGAEINAELEHQTARDSTRGAEKPLGSRHAKMADEVAK